MSSHSHTKPTQRSNRKPRNLPRIVRPRCPRGQTPTSTTPGETRQGGVKRSGMEAPRSHQLSLNEDFRTEEQGKPTHLKEKTNKKMPGLHNTTKRRLISRWTLSRDRGVGGGGDHTRAHQPLRPSQVKLLLPKFHRADSALRSQAAGGVGVCASVAPPAFGCRLG